MIPGIVAGFPASGGGGATDPYWDQVVSCLNFIGVDGATSTVDAKGLPWTFFGNAQIDTAQSANGTSSLLLDGSGDYISTPDTAVMRTNVPLFTIDAFVRLGASKMQAVFNKRRSSGAEELSLYVREDDTVLFSAYASGSSVMSLSSTGNISHADFMHVEVARGEPDVVDGPSRWYLFIDGNLEDSTIQSAEPDTNTAAFYIGRDGFNTTRDFNGWIGGFRRTNGVVRHTSNFTPPAAPFPTS